MTRPWTAILVVEGTKKYTVDRNTYRVDFTTAPTGEKTQVTTIEDFILFVEYVERQYPKAPPDQIVSEVRQLWFSDQNWELLVASQGVRDQGSHVDIETEPNPIAQRFDMPRLAPKEGSFQAKTRMGNVDIGHVMSGIDAALSGFPKSYPKAWLATFARMWFGKKAIDYRGEIVSKGWSAESALGYVQQEFDEVYVKHEASAAESDKLGHIVKKFVLSLSAAVR